MMHEVTISVIIPTLNEEETLALCLDRLKKTGVEECIVADGGSSDATQSVAVQHNVHFLVAPGGRAVQCNAGADQARGRIFCFLHADTKLPHDWQAQIMEVIDVYHCVGGAFRFGLTGDRLTWRIIEAGVNWRSRRLKLPYGDQAFFVRHDVFHALCGFKPMPFMEDVDFALRLKRYGPVGLATGHAFTSPRRWERDGVLTTTFRNYLVLLGYIFGMNPSTLHQWYVRPRGTGRPPDLKSSAGTSKRSAL